LTSISERDFHHIDRLIENLETCIFGKRTQIELMITAMLAEGHILLEDVPGTGKTVLVKALARSIQGQFRRIQCNPDLLPTDITGVSIYHPREENFVFRPGPVMTNILLVDEINRATTKTQSALLEAMEEKHITVDGEKYELPAPFILLATQNPVDFEGTYVLPEAQLDRFMMKFTLGYPDEREELLMVSRQEERHPLQDLQPVMDIHTVSSLQKKVREVYIHDDVLRYAVGVVRQTRRHPDISLGASPRASVALIQAAKAYALLKRRDYVLPDDIKFLVPFVLAHRLVVHPEARLANKTPEAVLASILKSSFVPVRMES
jgi:MoxR-like ATPase